MVGKLARYLLKASSRARFRSADAMLMAETRAQWLHLGSTKRGDNDNDCMAASEHDSQYCSCNQDAHVARNWFNSFQLINQLPQFKLARFASSISSALNHANAPASHSPHNQPSNTSDATTTLIACLRFPMRWPHIATCCAQLVRQPSAD